MTSEPENRDTLPLVGLLIVYAAWAVLYILRTSLEVDGTRYFMLWDDAMISMRYAQNFAAGDGLVWNAGGERVLGITNLGLSFVMALLHRLPVGHEQLSLLFQLANLAVLSTIIVLVHGTTRRLFGRRHHMPLWAAGLTALSGPLNVWSLQGSDVGFVSLLLVAAFWLVVRAFRAEGDWSAQASALLALGVLIRPDVSVFAMVFIAGSVYMARRPMRAALVGTGLILAVWSVLLLCCWSYYGDPLPNTWYLKATGHPRSLVLLRGVLDLAPLITFYAALILAQWGMGVWTLLRRDRAALLATACIGVAFAYNIWVGGDWLSSHVSRFIAPIIPLYLILLAGVCGRYTDAIQSGEMSFPMRARKVLFILPLIGSLGMNPIAPLREWLDPTAPTLLRDKNERNLRSALYLRKATAPETTVAVHWAGVPIYFSGRTGIDVLGKSDRHIARLVVDDFQPGHSKWDWDYVLDELRPDIFLLSTRGLMNKEAFTRNYLLARSEGDMQFFVHRSAAHRLLDPTISLSPVQVGPR